MSSYVTTIRILETVNKNFVLRFATLTPLIWLELLTVVENFLLSPLIKLRSLTKKTENIKTKFCSYPLILTPTGDFFE